MAITTVIHQYLDYNQWSNHTIVKWLKSLDETILVSETKSSFASIALTLRHMRNAQEYWYAVITCSDNAVMSNSVAAESFEQIIGSLLDGSGKMFEEYSRFNQIQLLEVITAPAMRRKRYEFIMHVVNHNTYHRGQIVSIARFLGVSENIPETDFDTYLFHSA